MKNKFLVLILIALVVSTSNLSSMETTVQEEIEPNIPVFGVGTGVGLLQTMPVNEEKVEKALEAINYLESELQSIQDTSEKPRHSDSLVFAAFEKLSSDYGLNDSEKIELMKKKYSETPAIAAKYVKDNKRNLEYYKNNDHEHVQIIEKAVKEALEFINKSVVSKTSEPQIQLPVQPSLEPVTKEPEQQSQGMQRRTKVLIGVSALAAPVLAAIIGGLYYLYKKRQTKKQKQTPNKAQ